MSENTSIIEPLLPPDDGQLQDLAREVVSRSSAIGGGLHPHSLSGIIGFLRLINSYYSNLIEGNSTHPSDIERAVKEQYELDSAKRDLQFESLAHIKCQKIIEQRLRKEPEIDPSSADFIRWMHKTFYDELPESLKMVKHSETEEVLQVSGGALRYRGVKVGSHIGPVAENVLPLLERFSTFYQTGRLHGLAPVIATAAAHHRLMWIHPFLDGNGRIARLYTDACFQVIPVRGYGLWNVSRGLARNKEKYMMMLALADSKRLNDYDGRGALSARRLLEFCTFFLEVCLDQIAYMGTLLDIDGLLGRIMGYVRLRHEKIIPAPLEKYSGLKLEAGKMLQEVLLRGEMPRGEVAQASGLSRAGRAILAQLLDEGILVSDMPKGSVRLGFPTHMSSYLFPDLYPASIL